MSTATGAEGAWAIQTVNLVKRYAEVTAVDDLNLRVRNGAGKTTTIRMLLGLIRPTRGRVLLFGRDVEVERRAAVRPVGSLVETATAYAALTVRENLEIQRTLTGAGPDATDRVIRLLGLEALAGRRAGRLSLGNKQRLAVARALLADPRLLVLDEPANALDPAGIVEVRRMLRRLAEERGVTVFVSSHILAEVAQLADRIGIIHRGKLVEEMEMGSSRSSGRTFLALRVSEPGRAQALLRNLPGVDEVRDREDGGIVVAGSGLKAHRAARLCLQVLLLSSVPAWIAVATRGYLAPLGLSILFLLVGDVFAHTGWGLWVPWAIPLMSAGAAGPDAPVPGVGSLLVLVLTFVAGAVATWAT